MAYPKSNKDRATFWLRKVEHSLQARKEQMDAGDTLRKQYENVAANLREEFADALEVQDNLSRVKPSLVYAWIDQTIANLLQRIPTFRVSPKKKDSQEGAPVVQKIIQHDYRETDQNSQDRRVLLDAFTYPFGVKKTGWTDNAPDSETLSDLSDLILDDPEEENLFLAIGDLTVVAEDQDQEGHIKAHMELLDDPEVDQDIKENVIIPHIEEHEAIRDGKVYEEQHQDIKEDQPFGQWWPAQNFTWDPASLDGIKDAGWIAFRSVRSLDDVKANPNYKNTKDLKPTTRIQNAPEAIDPDDDDFGVVVLWEIWARRFPVTRGKRNNVLVVIAETGSQDGEKGKILRHDTEWPYKRIKNYPARLLMFEKSQTGGLPMPLLHKAGADNLQGLLNEFLDSWMHTMRKQKNWLFYDSDLFSEDVVEMALKSPEDGASAVDGLSKAQGSPIITLPFTEISSSKNALINEIMELFNNVAGTPGPGGSAVETATEASINEKRTTAREGVRLDEFKRFQIETAEDFWALHTQFKPEADVLIDEKADEWVQVDGNVVRGSYRFDIDIASQATALAIERKQWQDLLNLFGGLAQQAQALGLPTPNLPLLAQRLLVRGFEEENPEEIWPAIQEPGVAAPALGINGAAANGAPNGIPQGGPLVPSQFSAPPPSESAIAGNALSP